MPRQAATSVKTCLLCNKGYLPKRSNQKFCSPRCAKSKYFKQRLIREPNYFIERHLREWFNLTLEDVISRLDQQKNCCAICKQTFKEYPHKNTHVDHCHRTGKFRGMLCFSCNSGLGHFKDNPSFLKEAIKYLERTCG